MKHYKGFGKQILLMIIFNAVYSGAGIAILAFINKYLLGEGEKTTSLIFMFFGLLVLFLALSVASRAVLCVIENNFVFNLRSKVIKQIIDTKFERIEAASKANLLASLSSDISRLTDGFMRISELIQGGMTVVFAGIYTIYISPKMFLFLFVWIGALMILNQLIMRKVMQNFDAYRKNEDELYKNYSKAIEGHKELSLNIKKARYLYENEFIPNANNLRQTSLKAQVYQAFAGNFMSVMMLGAVGVVLFWGLNGGAQALANAVTIALTILFLRAPLMMLVFSFPSILRAKIAYQKIEELGLDPHVAGFEIKNLPAWEKLELKNVSFTYKNGKFGVKNLNLAINSGEVVFLVGENGSGKSTLFMILSGLYGAQAGEIRADGRAICADELRAYSNNISAVFSDFYLFDYIVGDENTAREWLEIMEISQKVSIEGGKFSTTNLSAGQRKRLALAAALSEGRKFIMLDEWAADQDPHFRAHFYECIIPRLKERGYTIFAISHDDKYFGVADKIYKMSGGEISQIR
ncbi:MULTISPECIES: cyclic peptide export ABC transporter [unclassified Campylobacter]|uniref:cyclic peptide export ABC transporter n=1 Tax=unclassified Campylobacter TaxID=2593542 RepID=UPI0022E9B252|nr:MULTISPECIES: cyclic peptide export ABC transporter [unclassified Campylobacter]MDA3053784.1 cyclic peptide export ABC transporter [Campylobacter sp. VBCF_07 NA4]MDA3060327.1 cyclic peptide export ABC transporter [Campylobacter sp. VBCF_02 NA5]MDA3069837.1 cyclic peptide export ABC transporter [Campylobacter sp. VBCF_08 NA3]WBR54836.1 cyclic peptide export ABC transporter [Campylobacter sp. VBCF_01 NA2]